MAPETRAAWLAARTTHGGFVGGKERPEHYIWRSMIARCTNPKAASYRHYGARNIKVCKSWEHYEQFLADMGERPSAKHSLDRIDTNGDYQLDNCRWATRSEQQRNKTSTRRYSNGEFTGTLVECAAKLGISKELAHWRWKQHATFRKGEIWHELPKPL